MDSEILDLAVPSDWQEPEWRTLTNALPESGRTVRLHPALQQDLIHELASQEGSASRRPPPTNVPPPEPPAESSEDNSSVEAAASSFLEGFHAESVLETTEKDDADVTKDAVELEASLQDTETSPVVALLDQILLSTALIRQKVLPDMGLNMLAIGEETGEMDRMLSKVADFYEDEVGAMVKALTSMLEPAMIVLVGGIVGSILLAMYLPMFTVFDQIQ